MSLRSLIHDTESENSMVRLQAIHALEKHTSCREVMLQLEHMLEDSDWQCALAALKTLNKHQYQINLAIIREALVNHKSKQIRAETSTSLKNIAKENREEAIQLLEELTMDEAKLVRDCARRNIGLISGLKETCSRKCNTHPLLWHELKEKSKNERRGMIDQWCSRNDAKSREALKNVILYDSWWGNRLAALRGLIKIASDDCVMIFAKATADKRWNVRLEALNGLQKQGSALSKELIQLATEDPHPQVRRHARLLSMQASPETEPAPTIVFKGDVAASNKKRDAEIPEKDESMTLCKGNSQPLPEQHSNTAGTVSSNSVQPDIISMLLDGLQSNNNAIHLSAGYRLMDLNGGQATQTLLEFAIDSENEHQSTACIALANFEGDEVEIALAEVLQDEHSKWAHKAAIFALKWRRSKTAVNALIFASNSKDRDQRLLAIDALGPCKDMWAVRINLDFMLKDSSAEIREAVVCALCGTNDPDSLQLLEFISRTDASWRVRAAALHALKNK